MIMVIIVEYHFIYDIDIVDVLVTLGPPPNRYGRKSTEKPPKNSPR